MSQQKPLVNWSEVVSTVSKIGKTNEDSENESLRKLSYRSALQKQIEEHQKNKSMEISKKLKQKQRIAQELQKQKIDQIQKKLGRVQAEQKYQVENMFLLKNNKRGKSEFMQRKNTYDNNQFFKLEDEDNNRKIQTKKNFELQNILNNQQKQVCLSNIQIRNKCKSKEKQQNIQQKEQFNSYVEGQYKRHQSDRQFVRNKYLFHNEPKEKEGEKQLYRLWLKNQIEQKKSKGKYQNQRIDERLKGINQTVERMTASPAYLGLSESFDRKKQISLLDRHLHLGELPTLQKQTKIVPPAFTQRKKVQSQCSNYIRHPKSQSAALLEIKKQIQPHYQPQSQPLPNSRYQDTSLSQSQKKKQYNSYNFITGTNKAFFV